MRVLKHETSILPMEIFLKYRRVQHAGLTRNTPVQQTTKKTCLTIRHQSKGNDNYVSFTKDKGREVRSRICGGEVSTKRQKELGKIGAYQKWGSSWSHQDSHGTRRHRTTADPEVWNAAKIYTDNKTGTKKMNFLGTPSQLHRHLKKSQSSITIQIRSEHIGFAAYLYGRNVPGVNEPSCQ
ncbi:hypothetical protein K3495_g5582 [Podosphaera aphanis]|nr:hypothetical protein K3495_g5582 [Podosphaera aphanis]